MTNALNPCCRISDPALSSSDGKMGIYFPCPDCGTYFKTMPSFAGHMTGEHWWDPQNALTYWDRYPTLKSA